MIIRQEDGPTPYYDPIQDASMVSVKVNHGGIMKHKPTRHYVGGNVQLIDHVDVSELKLSQFKTMAEMCGYGNDSVVFWHKFGKFRGRMKLVSTDVEANFVSKNIPGDRIIEICFEHLDFYIDKDVEATCKSVGRYDKEVGAENSSSSGDFVDSDNDFREHRYDIDEEVRRKMAHEEGDTDCVISEEFKSLESDSSSESLNFPKFNSKTDWLNPVLALELTFSSKKEFIQAVITHEVNQGRYIEWRKNDKERARAVCSNRDCGWQIMASRMYRDKAFQIKTYNSSHSCKNWNHKNNKITSTFIARRYLELIRTNRDWKISEFRDIVSVQLRAHVTTSKCRRAKKKALAIIDGDINENYKVLWNYCNEIVRTNPNTSVYIKLVENEVPNRPDRFQRFYICFDGCKEGFKNGCRKIVGVDGCWLKGPMYGAQLLTAISLDPNNNIFPIAYAIVEKERRESWSWFLNNLKLDLEIDEEANWTFMSDKQKGLIEVFNEVLPFVNHRFCVRHLHNNFKRAGFSGNSLRDALWKAAGATTPQLFDVRMDEILKLDPEAADWLRAKSPSEWSRSHFSDNVKCDTLLNNMCECFNSMILEARDKPIITLLEKIRYLLMERMQANIDKASN